MIILLSASGAGVPREEEEEEEEEKEEEEVIINITRCNRWDSEPDTLQSHDLDPS